MPSPVKDLVVVEVCEFDKKVTIEATQPPIITPP